jgi:hypothetical protein
MPRARWFRIVLLTTITPSGTRSALVTTESNQAGAAPTALAPETAQSQALLLRLASEGGVSFAGDRLTFVTLNNVGTYSGAASGGRAAKLGPS